MPVDPLLSRRALLGVGTITLATLSGCASDRDPVSSSVAPAANGDPDQDLLDRVLDELAGAEQLAVAAGVQELALLHRTHIEALDGTPPTPAPPPTPGSATVADLRQNERRLQTQLVDASMAAESGGLARLLASMSAAVSQQLVAL